MLDTLLEVAEIDKVVINTDAREKLAQHGLFETERVMIRDRKAEICGDLVSMNLVLADDIANVDADLYLMTHVTNPLLSAGTIRDALGAFRRWRRERGADSLFTVNRIQTRFYREDGSAVNHDPDNLVRTQDLEPWFEENSNLYLFTRDSFMATKSRIGKSPAMFESKAMEAIDIDTPQDWDIAVIAANYMRARPVQEK
jgi:CMP-N-acetylneuraminic acid synthetase